MSSPLARARGRPGVRRLLGRTLAALLLGLPGDAMAQSESVGRALESLHEALDGKYGDEGAEVAGRFDELMQRLSDRDRSTPVEAPDPDSPVTAYLALTQPGSAGSDLTRARETLRREVQAVIRGGRTRPAAGFPAGMIGESSSSAPRFPLARYAAVFASALQGQIDESAARMKDAAASDPLIVDPVSRSDNMQQAAASLRRGTLRDAVASLETLITEAPRSSEAHRMLAIAAGIAGDSRKSVEHFEAALAIRPDDERSWMALADTHMDTGSLAGAVRTLEKAVAAIPASGGLRWRLAGLLVRLERVGDALVQYTEADRLPPMSGRAAVHQAAAAAATLQQDLSSAVAATGRRLTADLNDAAAHRDLASLYMKQGRQDDAFTELAIAAWLDPDDPLTLVTLGQSLMAERRDEEAVAALERAVSLQPDLRDARYALAQALTRVSRRADAERHLAEFERQRAAAVAREQRALDIEALRNEAAMHSAAGRHRQAIDAWKKVIALEPEGPQNYRDLAEALVRAGALQDSLQYFVKTAELNGVAEVHLRLAEVLARLGRARESGLARETYERLRLEDFRRRSIR